jgi:hypothetical protein
MDQNYRCPVCETTLTAFSPPGTYNCPRCGEFILTGSLQPELPGKLSGGIHRRAIMSHKLRRMMQDGQAPPKISTYTVDSFWTNEVMPTPAEQADDLVLWAGDHQRSPDRPHRAELYSLGAWVGTSLLDGNPHTGIRWLLTHLADEKLLNSSGIVQSNTADLQLTMLGWRRYAELKKRRVESRTAFTAMKFGDPTLDGVVKDCFKPAVARTGFELRLLTDQPKAGLIDNHMRAALLASRFTIADLSHGSHGAYWEAGFAEGLDRPVFYTCKASVWEQQKSHFDTNHMHTILWDEKNLKKAEDELTDTIRATLREEAKQND